MPKKTTSKRQHTKTPNFGIKKWNARAGWGPKGEGDESLMKRGVLHEGQNGSFWVDVKFTSNVPGFVVQYIEKNIAVQNTQLDSSETEDKRYWEIFYIDESGESYNADGISK